LRLGITEITNGKADGDERPYTLNKRHQVVPKPLEHCWGFFVFNQLNFYLAHFYLQKMLNLFPVFDVRLRHLFPDPVTITVYTHTDTNHLFGSSASSIYTMLTCTVLIKCSRAVEVFFTALALIPISL
jgi:hypothetical protein